MRSSKNQKESIEPAPVDVMVIPEKSKNKALAKKFLLYLASADTQNTITSYINGISPRKHNAIIKSKFSQTGY